MNLVRGFQERGVLDNNVYYLIFGGKTTDEPLQFAPSLYLKEMQLSYEHRQKRLERLIARKLIPQDFTRSLCSNKKKCEPPFRTIGVTPQIILFQNVELGSAVTISFNVKNVSESSKALNINYEESPHFNITAATSRASRLAPGMCFSFLVTFTPTRPQDYVYQVVFATESESYYLPIIAIGPRPLLDFPDSITIPPAPIKIETSTSLIIRNIGTSVAYFKMSSVRPFSVQPKSGQLIPDATMELTVSINSKTEGESAGYLFIDYDSGESFCVNLYGSSESLNVRLEKSIVRFDETYIGLQRQKLIVLHNRSPHIVKYSWVQHETETEEFKNKEKLAKKFNAIKINEVPKSAKLEYFDVCDNHMHKLAGRRIYNDEIRALVSGNVFPFQDHDFKITPLDGEIWPNAVTEVLVTYEPKAIEESVSAKAFCEITGLTNRLPLAMFGSSMGSRLSLSVQNLNLDYIYFGAAVNYELVVSNHGEIPGELMYVPGSSLFGMDMKCQPECLQVIPDKLSLFTITFHSKTLGDFVEELNFLIRDTGKKLKLVVKGTVVPPKIKFDPEVLDFGIVSLGVSAVINMRLSNLSNVGFNISMQVTSNGPDYNSLSLKEYEMYAVKPPLPDWPKEFTIYPSSKAISEMSSVVIKVELIANIQRKCNTTLEIEVEASESMPFYIPVSFIAEIPSLTIARPINITTGFLDYPYSFNLEIENETSLWGYFILAPIMLQTEGPVVFEVDKKEGFIEPKCTLKFSFAIKATELGNHNVPFGIVLFGTCQVVNLCNISIVGVGPVISVTPIAMLWGEVHTLSKEIRLLTVINDSPIAARYSCRFAQNHSPFSVEPSSGVIEPHTTVDLSLGVYLVDEVAVTGRLIILIENTKMKITVPLTAKSIGTSITFHPSMSPCLDLGYLFTYNAVQFTLEVKNAGTKVHQLQWSTVPMDDKKTKKITIITPTHRIFDISPTEWRMEKKSTARVILTTKVVKKAQSVTENWYLYGFIEGRNKREVVMDCKIQAKFIHPLTEIKEKKIELLSNLGPFEHNFKLTEAALIKNIVQLDLQVEVTVSYPFLLVYREEGYLMDQAYPCITCPCEMNNMVYDVNTKDENNEAYMSLQIYEWRNFSEYKPHIKKLEIRDPYSNINTLKKGYKLVFKVEQYLKPKEIMKIQVVFDSSFHENMKSFVLKKPITILYDSHPHKDKIDVTAEINYPNVTLNPEEVDFQCVLNGCSSYQNISIHNPSPLTVYYEWYWEECYEDTIDNIEPYMPINQKSEEELPHLEPIEYTTQSSLEETFLATDHLLSNQDTSPPNITFVNKLSNTLDPDEHIINSINDIRRRLVAMFDSYDIVYDNEEIIQKLPPAPICNINDNMGHIASNYFEISPHRGYLKPGEVQCLTISFNPTNLISVETTAICQVLGGPQSILHVKGKSSELCYKLDKTSINFGRRVFYETCSVIFTLRNTGFLHFHFDNYAILIPPVDKCVYLLAGILDVTPMKGIVKAGETVEINCMYYPGVAGYFCLNVTLEIEHLQPIILKAEGWGIFPQIYFELERPSMKDIPVEIAYAAIASLTPDLLLDVHSNFRCRDMSKIHTFGSSVIVNRSRLLYGAMDYISDWNFCEDIDNLTIADIEIAIERFAIFKYLQSKPDIMTGYYHNSHTGIPGFRTEPYVIDFGIVVIGEPVCHVSNIFNHSPSVVKLFLYKPLVLPSFLRLVFPKMLHSGEVATMRITFDPSLESFTNQETSFNFTFYLMITYGVLTPIQLLAVVTLPYLKPSVTAIDFNLVKCGDMKTATFKLCNIGKIDCSWIVNVTFDTKNKCIKDHRKYNPFSVEYLEDNFEPGHVASYEVCFKPLNHNYFTGELIFNIVRNPKQLRITLAGEGLMPRLSVIGNHLKFSPMLPWSQKSTLYFGLVNPCSKPIEVYFLEFDSQYKEEDNIAYLMKIFYGKEELCIPLRETGALLPKEIPLFYWSVIENVLKRSSSVISHTKHRVQSSVHGKNNSAGKIRATSAGPVSTRETLTGSGNIVPSAIESISQLEQLAAEINAMKLDMTSDNHMDPLQDLFDKTWPPPVEVTTDKTGAIIIFYGYPYADSESLHLAYLTAKFLKIPIINVDNCILETLASSDIQEAVEIREIIDNLYTNLHKSFAGPSPVVPQSSIEIVKSEDFDAVEIRDPCALLKFKVNFIKARSHMISHGGKSKAVEKKLKAGKSQSVLIIADVKKMDTGSITFLNIPEAQLSKVLTTHLEAYSNGFIVDSLDSVFMKYPSMVLTAILRAKPLIKYIEVVITYNTIEAHTARLHEKHFNIIAQSKQELLVRVEEIDNMSAESYDKLPYLEKRLFLDTKYAGRVDFLRFKSKKDGMTSKRDRASMMKTDERDKDKDKEKEKDKDKDKDKEKEKEKGKDKESQNKSPKDDFFDVKLIMDTFSDFYRSIWPPLWSLINLWNQELGDVDSLQKASPGKKGVNLKNVTGDVASMIFDQKESLGFAHTFLTNFSYEAKETIATSLSKNPLILNAISPLVKHDTFASNPLVFKAYTMLIPRSTTEIKPSDGTFFSIINVDEAPIPKCECRKMKKNKKLTSWECGCEQMLAVSMARKPIINDKPIAKLAKKDFADQKDIAKLLSIAAGEKTLFHPRTVMAPNEMMRYEISFDPKVEGLYQTTYDVEVQGWPQSHTQVKVEGICDIPRIDFRPKKMFKKLIRDYNEDVLYFNSYIDTMHHFEFGPVFKTSIKNKILPVKFIIRNTSTLPMQVVFTFLKGGIYNISPTEMSLPPGVRKSLSVSAAPPSIGAQPDELLFCVKDNPCIGIVKINCIGITANFSVNLRTLDFGKLLLYRRGKKRIILSNKCVLPIKWKIRPNPDMDKLFVFSESKGVIQPKKMVEVEVEFFANIVGEFHGIPLHFDIYDFNEIEEYSEVLTSEVLTLSAECYDVLIDCMFNDFEDDHLDFGDIRIASTQELTMTLGNRGNNEMLYRISKAKFSQMDGVKFDPEENIESKGIAARKFANGLFVEPTHGLILPGHAYVVTVLYESMVPLEAKRIHTLSVELLDPSKHGHDGVEGDEGQPGVQSDIPHSSGAADSPRAPPPTAQPASDPSREAVPQHIPQVIVATLPIAVSVCVLYNSFVLHPAQDLNFDAFLVGGKQALNLTLKNTGKFAFFFQLFPPNTPVDFPPLDVKDVELKEEKRTEVSNKQEKEKQDKKDKVQRKDSKIKKLDIKASKKESKSFGGPIKLGIFYVSVTSGMIEEDEAIIIPIECVGEKEGFFEEKLKLHITHVHPKYADGIDVRLLAEICLPDIDFWKADTTFRELYVTKTRKDFCCPMALGAHCLYTTEERCVYFLRVAVKTPVQCTLYLNNPTRVSATVTLEARCLPPQVSPTQAAPAPIQPSPGAPSGAIASPIAASAIVGGEQPVFSVTPKFVHLEPYNTAAITLTFAPLVMLEYRGYMDVNLKMPDNQPAKYWQLSLRGRGDAPRIKLERPPAPPPPAPPAPLSFPLLLVGCKLKKSIAIRNICSLALDVVLDIDEPNPHIVAAAETINSVMTAAALSGSPSPPPPTPGPVPISPYDRNDPVGRVQYYLRPERAEKLKHFFFDLDQHMEKHLVEIDQNDEKKYSMKLHLEPDDLAEFNIVFCPMREGKYEVEIKINIINNPFENIILFCKGESFMENLIITDLETLSVEKSTAVATDFVPAGRSVSVYTVESKVKKSKKGTDPDSESILSRVESRKSQRRSFSDSQVSDITEVKYNLDLGRVAVKQLVKKAFNIHNNTLIGHRFQWFGNELMDFTPSSGHIYPTASKEIVIAFLSHDPINLQNLPVLCSLAPMKGILSVKEDYNNVQPWDDQLLASMWKISPDGTHYVKESKLVVPAEPEKDYDEVNRYFILQLNIIADYAAYECNLETIIFKNTLMFQTRNFEIIVKNTGNIPLNISWNFDIGDDYPVTRVPSRVELMDTIHGDEHPREPRESPFNKLPDGGSLFSECSQRTCDSWSSLEFPFSISPSKATININEEGKFCLSFAPKDIFDFHVKLESKIESLNEQQSDCIVDVYGRSLLPYCHLDVEESDYVNAHRRDPTLPPLPPDTRVVEYNVFGCGCYHKQFKLMNPTSEDYTYEWIPMVEREYSPIHFEPCRGTLKMGSEEEVNITFTPAGLGVIESLWTFVISKYDVKINFLVVGFVREPSVYFIPSHLDMRPTIKGARVRETIKMIQCEDIPLKFAFEEGSLFTDGLNESLEVSPMTGYLDPQSETTIEVSYTPARTGLILFKLRCQVCYVINPLYITVSCNCLALVPEARLFLRGQILPLRPYAPTDVPLGCIVLNVTEKLIIELRNKGECMFFFEVVYNKYKPLDVVINPTHGCVEPNESVKVDIALTSLEKGLIKNFPITLKVLEGPTYNIIIDSEVTDPAFYFMSTYIDFGPCFIEYPPDFYSTKFFVRNTSSDEILITAEIPESDEIKCVLENGIISPWNDGEILVYFIPRRVHIYQFELVFTINGVCRQKIVVDGEGIALALVLVNPCDKCFTFGGVIVGQEVMKEIKLHNQSKSALTVDFHLPIEVPVKELSVNDNSNNFTQQTKMSNKEKDKDKGKDMDKANKKRKLLAKTARSTSNMVLKKKDSQQEVLRQLMRESLVINPTSYTFQSGEIASVCIQFKPVKSGKHLQEEVWMTTAGVERAICVVRAHALGASIRLDRELLSFGAVTIGCQSTQKFVLVNMGDVGARFEWELTNLNDNFEIFPKKGYAPPESNTVFKATFAPHALNQFVDCLSYCMVENFGRAPLRLVGSCVELPAPYPDPIIMRCMVRKSETTKFRINNLSDTEWNINPIISGVDFTTIGFFNVPPNSSFDVPITFNPITMGRHEGRLFLPATSYFSLLYDLYGEASEPEAITTIERTVPCKTKYTELLEVKNWLQIPQKLTVMTSRSKLSGSDRGDPYYEINGLSHIAVPADGVHSYKWSIYCYKPCQMTFVVKFLNEDSGEFLWYTMVTTVTKCETIEFIKMKTTVRKKVAHTIFIKNPMESNADFKISCPVNDIYTIEPFFVEGESIKELKITYFPLLVGEYKTTFELINPNLGVFPYALQLECVSGPNEKVECEAVFGYSVKVPTALSNFTKRTSEFTFETDNDCFQGEKKYNVGGNEKLNVDIIFEPRTLGNITAQLTFRSLTAGNFVFDVIAKSLEPQPQGPINIKPNVNTVIPFRNIFKESKTFRWFVEPSIFFCLNYSQTMKPKTEGRIVLSMKPVTKLDGETEKNDKPYGRLVISCADPQFSHVNWVYYLTANIPD